MTNILISQFILFVLVFIRLVSMIAVAPIFGHEALPPQVKIALGLFLALTFYPIVSKTAPSVSLQLAPMAVMVFQEAIIGLLMGFAVNMIFSGAMMAGEFISFNMGLGFAHFFDRRQRRFVRICLGARCHHLCLRARRVQSIAGHGWG